MHRTVPGSPYRVPEGLALLESTRHTSSWGSDTQRRKEASGLWTSEWRCHGWGFGLPDGAWRGSPDRRCQRPEAKPLSPGLQWDCNGRSREGALN